MAAADGVAAYLSEQLQLLQLGGFVARKSAGSSSCTCSVNQVGFRWRQHATACHCQLVAVLA
jgi:hypothetical protein